MVSSSPGGVVQKGQAVGERVDDVERTQQPLRVLVQLQKVLPGQPLLEPLERAVRALALHPLQ